MGAVSRQSPMTIRGPGVHGPEPFEAPIDPTASGCLTPARIVGAPDSVSAPVCPTDTPPRRSRVPPDWSVEFMTPVDGVITGCSAVIDPGRYAVSAFAHRASTTTSVVGTGGVCGPTPAHADISAAPHVD